MELSRDYQERKRSFEGDPDYILHGLLYEIAESIYVAMEEQGLTQAELAARAGMKPPALSRFLRTASNTTLRTIVRLAVALDLEVAELLMESAVRAQAMRHDGAEPTAARIEDGLLRPAWGVGGGAGEMWRPDGSRRQPATDGPWTGGGYDDEHSQLNAAT